MPRESKYSCIHIPCGCTVLVGNNESDLVDIGVIPEETDSSIQITYDMKKVNGSKRETVMHYISNMLAKGTTAIYQVNLENINKLAGGIMDITKGTGAAVSAEKYTIAPGFAKETFYRLPGQNASGEKQKIDSAKAGSTALAEGTDYIQAKGSDGSWGIIIPAASTASGTITITYGYTPISYIDAYIGSAVREINTKMVRFLKEYGGKKFYVDLMSAVMTNGIQIGFPSSSSDNPVSIPIEIEGTLDPSLADGRQLVRIHDEIGVEL